MKKKFLTRMKHSMMAILAVVAAGMFTAPLPACATTEDEGGKNWPKWRDYLPETGGTANRPRGTFSF